MYHFKKLISLAQIWWTKKIKCFDHITVHRLPSIS